MKLLQKINCRKNKRMIMKGKKVISSLSENQLKALIEYELKYIEKSIKTPELTFLNLCYTQLEKTCGRILSPAQQKLIAEQAYDLFIQKKYH